MDKLSSKQKKGIALFVVILLLLMLRSCGSDRQSEDGQSVSLGMLLSARNKDASTDDKFYEIGQGMYGNKSGISVQELNNNAASGTPCGIIFICNENIDQKKMKTEFLQLAATVQNKKKLSDKEGEKLIQELHLFDTDEATVYKTQVDKIHFEKLAYNTVDVGGVKGFRVPVTAIYFYPEGASKGGDKAFEAYVKKAVVNKACELDRQQYLYHGSDSNENKIKMIQ